MLTWLYRESRNQKGFTLIELLVVVAIIALLTAFAVPRLFDAINKSKGSVGDSDLNTISDALERYYFDENAYPLNATSDPAQIQKLLKEGGATAATSYLKGTTSFKNGFGGGYVYITDDDGSYYLLVDPGPSFDTATPSLDATFTLACGTWNAGGTTFEAGPSFKHYVTTTAPGAELAKGCTLTKGASSIFDASKAHYRSN